MIALLRERQQRLRNRADTRGAHQAVVAVLQLGKRELERPRGRKRAKRICCCMWWMPATRCEMSVSSKSGRYYAVLGQARFASW